MGGDYIKDRLGNELKIGDKCVAWSHMITGSSTKRMVQYDGEVVGFSKSVKHAMVKCIECSESAYDVTNKVFKVQLSNIFKYPTDCLATN